MSIAVNDSEASSCCLRGNDWVVVDTLANKTDEGPRSRSAHILCNRYPGSVASPRALIVHGGESESGERLNCTWSLDLDELASGRQAWRLLQTRGDVTARSNHAAVVYRDCLFVFGGVRGENPGQSVGDLEVLDFNSLRWARYADSDKDPSPRQNLSLVLSETPTSNCLVAFGGYDRTQKFDDLFCFDLMTYTWERVAPGDQGARPPPTTDHCAVVVDGYMVVFGGVHSEFSVEDGMSHVWRLQLESLPQTAHWERFACSGEAPLRCTAHAAASVGSLLLVAGGLRDWTLAPLELHVLNLDTFSWSTFGHPHPEFKVCRHAATFADGFFMTFGGYNGKGNHHKLLRISLAGLLGKSVAGDTLEHVKKTTTFETPMVTAMDMFKVEQRPLTIADLPPEAVQGKSSRQFIRVLHSAAVARQLDMYIDPESGYPAFTKLYLQRRDCCGNGCRHCPWGHVNVSKSLSWKANCPYQQPHHTKSSDLDW